MNKKVVVNMDKNVTATDVAKLAGVSQSSVSRVYFEGASVSEKTRQKVLAAAEELGYRPNELARSLITNRTKLIGIVMKGVQNPFYPQVLMRFTEAFKALGYSVMFVHTNNDEIQKEDIENLLNYNAAGVVITDASLSLNVAEDFKRYKIPVVFFNRKITMSDFHSVCCNNLDASRNIARFLVDKGCRDIVYISGNRNTSTSREREQGFTNVLSEDGIAPKRFESDYTYESGYYITQCIIKENAVPEAFFAANDIIALGVVDALRKNGFAVPERVKVIGFDDIEMASWPVYSLTTWRQPIEEMVEKTVRYLISEIDEYTGTSSIVELDGSLIERQTT